jgi:hypothetical protein
MRRWILRALPALVISTILPVAATAQQATPPVPHVGQPAPNVAGDQLPVPAPGAAVVPGQAGSVYVVPNGAIILDPYHAATPYNPTISQPVPNSMLNRPVTMLPCTIPNQNLDPYYKVKKGCKNGCGNDGGSKKGGCGCGQPCTPPTSAWGQLTHPYCGICSKGGSYTTGCNTFNFALASSRSYFGESSREFFERPPSIDGVKMQPKAYAPPPAPAAYIPPNVVVVYALVPPKQEKGVVTGPRANNGQPAYAESDVNVGQPVIVDQPAGPEAQ